MVTEYDIHKTQERLNNLDDFFSKSPSLKKCHCSQLTSEIGKYVASQMNREVPQDFISFMRECIDELELDKDKNTGSRASGLPESNYVHLREILPVLAEAVLFG